MQFITIASALAQYGQTNDYAVPALPVNGLLPLVVPPTVPSVPKIEDENAYGTKPTEVPIHIAPTEVYVAKPTEAPIHVTPIHAYGEKPQVPVHVAPIDDYQAPTVPKAAEAYESTEAAIDDTNDYDSAPYVPEQVDEYGATEPAVEAESYGSSSPVSTEENAYGYSPEALATGIYPPSTLSPELPSTGDVSYPPQTTDVSSEYDSNYSSSNAVVCSVLGLVLLQL